MFDHVGKAVEELRSATKYQKKVRKKMCCVIVVLIVVLIVILAPILAIQGGEGRTRRLRQLMQLE